MIRGTTPTHIFNLPFVASTITKLRVTYKQKGEKVLEKTETDCTIAEDTVKIKLTQEESLKFVARENVEVQLRAKYENGEVLSHTVKELPVERVLNEEVL